MVVSEGTERGKTENEPRKFQEILIENFSNLEKGMNIHIHESQRTPNSLHDNNLKVTRLMVFYLFLIWKEDGIDMKLHSEMKLHASDTLSSIPNPIPSIHKTGVDD